jgi:hypothetical protein
MIDVPMKRLLQAIIDFREKPFLLTATYKERKFAHAYQAAFVNADHCCPYCGNREAWQKDESYASACKRDPDTEVPLLTDCPEDSRPYMFTDVEEAINATKTLMQFKSSKYSEYWSAHTDEAQHIIGQIEFLKNKIANLQNQKATVRDKSNQIQALITEKEAQIKAMSLFSPDKKAAKAELKELNTRYTAQRDADILEDRRIDAELKSYENQLRDMHIEYPGVENKAMSITPEEELIHYATVLT